MKTTYDAGRGDMAKAELVLTNSSASTSLAAAARYSDIDRDRVYTCVWAEIQN
jgi:hypothetical protein